MNLNATDFKYLKFYIVFFDLISMPLLPLSFRQKFESLQVPPEVVAFLEDLYDRIGNLENESNKFGDISQMKKDLNSLESDVKDIKKDTSDRDINQIKSDLSDLKEDIKQINETLKSHNF